MTDHEVAFLADLDTHLQTTVASAIAEPMIAIDADLAPFATLCLSASTTGGKRLRPRFAFWAWRTVVATDDVPDTLVSLGCALELLHAAVLVHDDVIDDSELRRGRPSVRAVLCAHHRSREWAGSAPAFGDHAALLIGDALWGTAQDLFDEAVGTLAPHQRRLAVEQFRAMRVEVISGQLLELRAQACSDFSPGAARKILRYKTSCYTVERPMQLGLTLGGAPQDTTETLNIFARATGQAFQLRDDLADLFDTSLSSGKSRGDDIRSGKPTELLGTALRLASESSRRTLTAIVGRGDATAAEIDCVKGIFVDSGAVEAVTAHIATLVETAVAALAEVTDADHSGVSPAQTALIGLLAECTDLSFLAAD